MDNNNYKLVNIQKNQTLNENKQMYKLNYNPIDYQRKVSKAMLIGRGFTQMKIMNHNEIFHLYKICSNLNIT